MKHLNDISKKRFLLSGLGVDVGDNNTKYRRYTLRLIGGKDGNLIFNDLTAKGALLIVESLIDYFLADRENNPLLYAFA